MLLKRAVTLKVIVTEKYKEETTRALEEAIEETDRVKSQIDFRSRIVLADLQRVDLNQAGEFRRRVEAEKHRQDEMKEQLKQQLEVVTNAEIGDEHVQGQIEGLVEVAVGDNLVAKLGNTEIVTRDDEVVELRESQPEAAA